MGANTINRRRSTNTNDIIISNNNREATVRQNVTNSNNRWLRSAVSSTSLKRDTAVKCNHWSAMRTQLKALINNRCTASPEMGKSLMGA